MQKGTAAGRRWSVLRCRSPVEKDVGCLEIQRGSIAAREGEGDGGKDTLGGAHLARAEGGGGAVSGGDSAGRDDRAAWAAPAAFHGLHHLAGDRSLRGGADPGGGDPDA